MSVRFGNSIKRAHICALAAMAAFIPLQSAHAKGFSVLWQFQGWKQGDGSQPYSGLLRDSAGNLYGTTSEDGAYRGGTVFRVAPDGNETVLYSFCHVSPCSDGEEPFAGLIQDGAGNLYGATPYGGSGSGVVFKLSPHGTETVLYSFAGGNDGTMPATDLIMDKKGNFYGATIWGGGGTICGSGIGCGTVYEVAPDGTEKVLYAFTGGNDGSIPHSKLVMDRAGNLYGTTQWGGQYGGGTVFKLSSDGTYTVLYSFTGGSDGWLPTAGLVMDKNGNLYGTASEEGANNAGTVFKFATDGTYTILYSFRGGSDGASPYARLIKDKKGNLYGTTYYGGGTGCSDQLGCGTVFKLAPDGTETVLYAFQQTTGAAPLGALVADDNGYLYGTTVEGGDGRYCDGYQHEHEKDCGTVFKVKK